MARGLAGGPKALFLCRFPQPDQELRRCLLIAWSGFVCAEYRCDTPTRRLQSAAPQARREVPSVTSAWEQTWLRIPDEPGIVDGRYGNRRLACIQSRQGWMAASTSRTRHS